MNVQIVLIALLLSTSVNAAAAERDTADTKIRTWEVPNEFHAVTVSDNVNIILAENPSATISIQGKTKLVDAIQLAVKNGELHISSKRIPLRNKAVVYIPVRLLSRLTVNGASDVQSMGYLQSANLHIRLNGHCRMQVKSTGTITIDHSPEWEIEYIRSKGSVIKRGNP